mgnify:CR=1 FL=1
MRDHGQIRGLLHQRLAVRARNAEQLIQAAKLCELEQQLEIALEDAHAALAEARRDVRVRVRGQRHCHLSAPASQAAGLTCQHAASPAVSRLTSEKSTARIQQIPVTRRSQQAEYVRLLPPAQIGRAHV